MRSRIIAIALALTFVSGCSTINSGLNSVWSVVKAPFEWVSGGAPEPETLKQKLAYTDAAVTSAINSVARAIAEEPPRITKEQAAKALAVLKGMSASLDVAWELEKAGDADGATAQIKIVENQLRLIELYVKN